MNKEPIQFETPVVESRHMKNERRKEQMIDDDIAQIEKALVSSDENEVIKVHRKMDGKYQVCISEWGRSMYAYHSEHGFIYDNLEMDSLKDNLEIMRYKLESFKYGLNASTENEKSEQRDVSVVVNNNIRIDITFEQARQKIEDMEGLTQAESEEIISKIDELEQISKEPISKKKKWEKINPILRFVLDKSVDVAIMVFNLFLQMNL